MSVVQETLEDLYRIEKIVANSRYYPATHKGKEYGERQFEAAFSELSLAEQLKFIQERPVRCAEYKHYFFNNSAIHILHDNLVEQSRQLDIKWPERPENEIVARVAAFLIQDYMPNEIGYRAMLSIMARAAGCELNAVFSNSEPKPVVALKYHEDHAPTPVKPKVTFRVATSAPAISKGL